MIDPALPGIFMQFITAVSDGRIDSGEAADLIEALAKLVPTDDLLDEAGDLIEDLLYRDAEELWDAAERKRIKAAEARAEGNMDKGARRDKRADELETKAIAKGYEPDK